MNIGLIDVDGHNFPNLALMKIARYHKQCNDSVSWYLPFETYDKVYMSKVFTHTPDYGYIINNAKEIIKGGTGYDIKSKLPEEIDLLQPDYSIYPRIDKKTAYGFLTRGCPNKCKWCVVPRKEGMIKPYMDIEEIAIEGRNNIILMDNNILAAGDYGMQQLEKIIKMNLHIDFNQAMDARLVNEENAELLAKIRWIDGRIRFGCDTQKQIAECERAIEMIERHAKITEYFLYTILTSDFEESTKRVEYWYNRNLQWKAEKRGGRGIQIHAQPYLNFSSRAQNIPQWQKDMAFWANKKQVYNTTSFRDFEPRKGFKCKEYFN